MDVQSYLRFKTAEREELSAKVNEFVARGGVIEVLAQGVSSKTDTKRTAHDVQRMNVQARFLSKKSSRSSTEDKCATQLSE